MSCLVWKKKVSPVITSRKKPEENPKMRRAAEAWVRRVRNRMQIVDKTILPPQWCDASFDDAECLTLDLLNLADRHFRRYGAGASMASIAIQYMDRTCIPITEHTSRKLIIVSTLLAITAFENGTSSSTLMAKCVGMSVSELNRLEVEFCESVDGHLTPPGSPVL